MLINSGKTKTLTAELSHTEQLLHVAFCITLKYKCVKTVGLNNIFLNVTYYYLIQTIAYMWFVVFK